MKKICKFFVLLIFVLCLTIVISHKNNIEAYNTTNGKADIQVKQILSDYYNNGVYRKDTSINLTETAKSEVTKMFHASCNHLVRTTYYNDEEIWMTNEQGTINSGYETVDGNMMHFKKVDGENVYDYTVENTITTEYYQTLKNLKDTAGWQVSGTSYINDHETVIDQFRQFVAPLWLATDEAKAYIVFTKVKLYVDEIGLHLELLTSETDKAKLTKSGVFAEALVTVDREEKVLDISSCSPHGTYYTHLGTSYDIKKTDYMIISLLDMDGNIHNGKMHNYIANDSIYNFSTYNQMETGTYEINLIAYSASGIYKGSVIICNSQIVSVSDIVDIYEQKIDNIVNNLEPQNYKEETYQTILENAELAKTSLLSKTSLNELIEVVSQFSEFTYSVEYDNKSESEIVSVILTFPAGNYAVNGLLSNNMYNLNEYQDGIIGDISSDYANFSFYLTYSSSNLNRVFDTYARLYVDGEFKIVSTYKILSVGVTYNSASTKGGLLYVDDSLEPIDITGNASLYSFAEVNANIIRINYKNVSVVTHTRIMSIIITYQK